MTSATATPSRGARGRSAEGHGYGLVLFAAVLLAIIGCFNLIYGIAAIANSHVFAANAHYVFASLRAWGWITLILGGLQLLAAAGVRAGSQQAGTPGRSDPGGPAAGCAAAAAVHPPPSSPGSGSGRPGQAR
jgi:hypothetical protein